MFLKLYYKYYIDIFFIKKQKNLFKFIVDVLDGFFYPNIQVKNV